MRARQAAPPTIVPRAGVALLAVAALVPAVLAGAAGCVGTVRETTTKRAAEEQMLTSSAAERAVARIDASKLKGRLVYIDIDRLESLDRGFVASAFSELVAKAGAGIVRTAEEADVIVEVRAAALAGYDASWTLWIPFVFITNAAGETVESPEFIDLGYVLHEAWARVQAFAYERESGRFVFGWGDSWGYAHQGFFDDIYPEQGLKESLKERVR